MIYRFELLLRALRRCLSRSEWAVRFMRLPVSRGTTSTPGLIFIQIDGLSHRQLDIAFCNGRMPFLRKLLKTENYRLHGLYSGLPSTTPAVQGELFYGIRGAVPAFSFRDHRSGEIYRMFDPDSAARVERHLARQGEPLLRGGSSYSNIFTGGAAESHFCPSSLGWNAVLKNANPLALSFLAISNAFSVLRTASLLIVEIVLATIDLMRGLIEGRDFLKELKFVPTRVAICIVLREMVTVGAQLDAARGLPVIHLNYLGYDEQAHRRGPTSKFAHWSLKGIDGCISRVWHAAKRSNRRSYDVWIYSDHGQEDVLPYPVMCSQPLDQAVAQVFEQVTLSGNIHPAVGTKGEESQRARLFSNGIACKVLPIHDSVGAGAKDNGVTVASMGPVALVYLDRSLTGELRELVANGLVQVAKVPLVLASDRNGEISAWTLAGKFSLLQQSGEFLGVDHPFLAEVTRDLESLCRHRDSGDFVLCGWAKGAQPCSFPVENGSHGGPGPEETAAFALLPAGAPLEATQQSFLRPSDLRYAAQTFLKGAPMAISTTKRSRCGTSRSFRIMTYNVHGCVGMDGHLSPERIARVIAELSPDVVALQELDVGRERSGWIDQAQSIAHYLKMEHHFHPALRIQEELYGNAILATHSMRLIRAARLPGSGGKGGLEPRGALWVAIDIGGIEVHIINTHLGLRPGERRLQAKALLGHDWIGGMTQSAPKILCGDFNALPASTSYRILSAHLRDTQTMLPQRKPKNTFCGRYPTARIDHVFVSPGIEVLGVEVPRSFVTRIASDHLPLTVDLSISGY